VDIEGLEEQSHASAKNWLGRKQVQWNQLTKMLHQAQYMKKAYGKRHWEVIYLVGRRIWLDTIDMLVSKLIFSKLIGRW
jgi:hypothetical protein